MALAPDLDRRVYPRHQRSDMALAVLDPLVGQVLDAVPLLKDISVGGARIETSARILAGESVRFKLTLPGGQDLTGAAKVRWVVEGGQGAKRQCGLEFMDMAWNGVGHLEKALRRGLGGSFLPKVALLDLVLLAACVAVVFYLLQVSGARPEVLRQMSLDAADNLPIVLMAGGLLAGFILCFRR
ncbi:MAG: PilZ domain-containing protein [Elusimicrobia bacterium]|nr:PilZ domain-containing protein [Elusimicrobiota bacterium]